MWSDELTLIRSTGPGSTNANGFREPSSIEEITIFANKLSVTTAEFYQAQQAGYTAELKFEIWAAEYNGEELVEYGGKRYRVLRTYGPKDGGDVMEIVLTDLSQKGGATDG